ncbi:MAG TPA: diguanylate cyclase, partial [Candidatus Aminicenantes bacterium]|nr:diguanylate cyclase [Candidatus Aminicenantes bacterium]
LMAERLRQVVSQMEIEEQNKTIKVTASFGATGFDTDTDDEKISPDAIINRADEHLYKAKREGRNRVCVGPL